jgi:TolA-binding protein
MKRQERQHLKENEFAKTTARMTAAVAENRGPVMTIVAVGLGIAVLGGGYYFYQSSQTDKAGAMLGAAVATAQSQVAPASTLPGQAQPPGTFPTEKARADAAIKAYTDVIAAYPNTSAGTVASYQLGSELLAAGRFADAEQQFRKTADKDRTSFYGTLARMGLANTLSQAGKPDEAIKIYSELAAERDTILPVDGVLMALAQANLKAGKAQDARAAFKRVVDEFPTSGYAADARQALGTE